MIPFRRTAGSPFSVGMAFTACFALHNCAWTEEQFEPRPAPPLDVSEQTEPLEEARRSEPGALPASTCDDEIGCRSLDGEASREMPAEPEQTARAEEMPAAEAAATNPNGNEASESTPNRETPSPNVELSPSAPENNSGSMSSAPVEASDTCFDEERNGSETGIDCGGDCEAPCAEGLGCELDADCQSGVCDPRQCSNDLRLCCQPPRCDDNVQNGAEGAVDCGGSTCDRCSDGRTCAEASDCVNNNCFDGRCISCGSGTIDGTETDVDCGGDDPACQRCRPGQRCRINSDCFDNSCLGGFC